MTYQPNPYQDYKQELSSDFNEAKFQILRLHNQWQDCNRYAKSGRVVDWKWSLDIIWRELSPDALKHKHKDQYMKKIKEINANISKSKSFTILYHSLQEKEIFLRVLQDDVGKGSKRSDRDEDDIDA